jgi:hypothetical protein
MLGFYLNQHPGQPIARSERCSQVNLTAQNQDSTCPPAAWRQSRGLAEPPDEGELLSGDHRRRAHHLGDRRRLSSAALLRRVVGGSLTVAKEDRDLDSWAAAAKELLRARPPLPSGAVARLILDPSLDRLGLRTVLLETTLVHRRTAPADWHQMLQVRLPKDDASGECHASPT